MTLSQRDLLTPARIEESLATLPEWEVKGKQIVRTYEFQTFADAIEAVNTVARIAEELNHHPDIHVCFRKVKLISWTHKVGGLTHLDFELAAATDKALLG